MASGEADRFRTYAFSDLTHELHYNLLEHSSFFYYFQSGYTYEDKYYVK